MSKKSIYLAIKEALKAKLPYLFIDLQKGQFLKPSENLPVPLPAALIEFQNIPWVEHSKIAQKGDSSFKVDLYLGCEQETFDEAEAENESLNMLDDANDVFKALNGITGVGFEYVERKAEEKPKYGKGYVQFTLEFRINIIEEY